MDLSLKKRGSSLVMECVLEDGDVIDRTSFEMLTNYSIKGFTKPTFNQFNSQKKFVYDIGSCVSLSEYMNSFISASRVTDIMDKLTIALENAEDYLIEFSSVIFEPDYIYMNTESGDLTFICLPFSTEISGPGNLINVITSLLDALSAENGGRGSAYINELSSLVDDYSDEPFGSIVKKLVEISRKNSGNVKRSKAPHGKYGTSNHKSQQTGGNQFGNISSNNNLQSPFGNPSVPNNAGAFSNFNSGSAMPSNTGRHGMAVPGMNSSPVQNVQQNQSQPAVEDDGEQISLFYLLQHYNPDNLKKYKAQKAQKEKSGGKPAKPAANKPAAQQAVNNAPVQNQQQIVRPNQPSGLQNQDSNGVKRVRGNFGATVYANTQATFGDNDADYIKGEPYLINLSNHNKVKINKEEFIIGRNIDEVDFLVEDSTVGRKHAKIVYKGGICKIYDLDSVNKTYVNDYPAASTRPIQLKSGDIISVSGSKLEFVIQ